MKFHHIGIAANSIEEAVQFCKNIGQLTTVGDSVYDELQDATVCMAKLKDATQVEFVSGKRVEGLLKKGTKLYHSCFEVENLDALLDEMIKNGGVIVAPPKPAILFNNRRVAFVATPLGIVELLEA